MLLSSNDNSTFMYVTIMLRSYYYHTGIILLVVQLPLSCAGIFRLGSRYSCVLLCTYPSEVSYFWYDLVLRPDKLKALVLVVETLSSDYKGKTDHGPRVIICQFSNQSWRSHFDTYYTDKIFAMRAISRHFILHCVCSLWFISFHVISN